MISKTMEDWFLRGGKRPEANGMQKTLPEPLDEIPVDDDEDFDDDNDDDDTRTFSVTMERTVVLRQSATVRIYADSLDSAMDRAEALAEDESDKWSWEDIPGTEEYEDCEAVEAEEADE